MQLCSRSNGAVAVEQIRDEAQNTASIASIKFSFDGQLMAAVMEGRIYLLDAFNGGQLGKFYNGMPYTGPALEVTFSPDSRYLLSGESLRSIQAVVSTVLALF
jgi:COMPASS component SWD2